jgi:hypothetical protein
VRYLVTTKDTYSPFLTEWFDMKNHFNHDIDMIVYDLLEKIYTTDGKEWHNIEIDML